MDAHSTFEDGFDKPPSHPASPGAEMVDLDLRELVERQHQQLMHRFDDQDEILKQHARRSQFMNLPLHSPPAKKISPSPTPTKLRGIPEAVSATVSAQNSADKSNTHQKKQGGTGGKRKKPKEEVRAVFQTFTQADMALRNLAAAVDNDRQKRRDDYTSSRSSDGYTSRWLQRLVRSPAFDTFFALLVLTNTLFIGVEVQQTLTSTDRPTIFYVVQYIYTGFFALELALRVGAGARNFFCGEDWTWGWLDVVVVSTSVSEIVFDILESQGVANMSGLSALRVVRVTRFLKTLRLIRVFRFVMALRTLITSILYTLRSLFWALVLLGLIIYLFSVLLAQAVSDYRLDPENPELPPQDELAALRPGPGELRGREGWGGGWWVGSLSPEACEVLVARL
jgi:hypothetical protein